ncbi:MAG: hypothetical protein ACOX4I_00310 [Anaerovoracaceae bacterium]|jgi:uncharacterized protein (DUF4213/DUF364 family)
MREKSKQLYQKIQNGFRQLIDSAGLDPGEIIITSQGLSTEEAIGHTDRTDFPIMTGKEVMLQAEYKGARGQAFTDAPAEFRGSLQEILKLDLINDVHARGLYIAALNAVMRYLGKIDHSVHCKDMEPSECSEEYIEFLQQQYGKCRLALIGYQPWLFSAIAERTDFELRVLDLNPENVGDTRFGVLVEHGIDDYDDVVLDWADLVLCTSSVFSNATMDLYIDIGKPVLFYGITGAGCIKLLGLDRHCPESA